MPHPGMQWKGGRHPLLRAVAAHRPDPPCFAVLVRGFGTGFNRQPSTPDGYPPTAVGHPKCAISSGATLREQGPPHSPGVEAEGQ